MSRSKAVDYWPQALQEGLKPDELARYREATGFAGLFDGMGPEACHDYAVWCITNCRVAYSQSTLFEWSDLPVKRVR